MNYIEAIRRHDAGCGLWSTQKLKSSRKIRSYLTEWKNLVIEWAGSREPDLHAVHVQWISPHQSPYSQSAEFSLPDLDILQVQISFFFLSPPQHAHLSSLWRKSPPQNASRESRPLPSPNGHYSPRGISYTKSQENRGKADFEGFLQVKGHYFFLNGLLFSRVIPLS